MVFPNYVGFSNQIPSPRRLARSGERIDHRVLNRLERIPFLDVVNEVQTVLTDSVLTAAVEALPPPYLEVERDRLLTGLKARRDQLDEYAQAYYKRLAGTVNVYGFDQAQDFVEFQRISKERVRVTLRSGTATGPIRYERLLDGRETSKVKLFIDPAQDQVIGNKDLPFSVEILPNGDLP